MHQGYPIVYMDESGFECETIRPFSYAPIGKPCIDSYNWQGKTYQCHRYSLLKKCYLRLITLSRISMAIYSTTGVNTPLFQALRLNA
jgi:hypothetical protein